MESHRIEWLSSSVLTQFMNAHNMKSGKKLQDKVDDNDGVRMKSEKCRLSFKKVAFSSFSSVIQKWWKYEKRDQKRCLMS